MRLTDPWPGELFGVWPIVANRSDAEQMAEIESRTYATRGRALAAIRIDAALFEDVEGVPRLQARAVERDEDGFLREVLFVQNTRRGWLMIERPGFGWFLAPGRPLTAGRISKVPSRTILLPVYQSGRKFCQQLRTKLKTHGAGAVTSEKRFREIIRAAQEGGPSPFDIVGGGSEVKYRGRPIAIAPADLIGGHFEPAHLARCMLAAMFQVSVEAIRGALRPRKGRRPVARPPKLREHLQGKNRT
jgi:hypothetical protein